MDCSPLGSSVLGILQQKYWSGLPYPPPGDLPDPGIQPMSLTAPALIGGFFNTGATWETLLIGYIPIQNKKFNLKKKERNLALSLLWGEDIKQRKTRLQTWPGARREDGRGRGRISGVSEGCRRVGVGGPGGWGGSPDPGLSSWWLFGCSESTHWTPGSSRQGLPVLWDAQHSFSLVRHPWDRSLKTALTHHHSPVCVCILSLSCVQLFCDLMDCSPTGLLCP